MSALSELSAENITNVASGTLGFPRMGRERELKFALERFWRKKNTLQELVAVAQRVETSNWQTQLSSGVNQVAVGLFSLYDHVLDWISYLGCVPQRFQTLSDANDLEQYFAMARGVDGIPALEMTKWFDTNYHYEVPEFTSATTPSANFDRYLSTINRALAIVGSNKASPVLLGPLTFLALGKMDSSISFETLLGKILPLYAHLLEELVSIGVRHIQIHEPALVCTTFAQKLVPHLTRVYGAGETRGVLEHDSISVNLVTYFGKIDPAAYEWFLHGAHVAALSLDFTRGDNLSLLEKYGFPQGKRLGAGLIDGRSVWKWNPTKTLKMLNNLTEILQRVPGGVALTLQPSCSLQHVPYTAADETFPHAPELANVLSFAYEKLDELALLKQIATSCGADKPNAAIEQATRAWKEFYERNPPKAQVQQRLKSISDQDFHRDSPFESRRPLQLPQLPLLPTTTIGSFPQTPQIRALRRKLKDKVISLAEYERQIDEQIAYNIGIQEDLGLDILVHGEPERTDMVEFFAEKLEGFAFTSNGWVQSYGSRCVRPPIIYADLVRTEPMTIREFKVAQSLTMKPVKGMLTGPVTILNWSFIRSDLDRKEQAFQIALCLRDEVKDLETQGCRVIQVDEPALREGMPLVANRKEEYLQWAIEAFQLSTCCVEDATSIHTHMCYCEFEDCMHAIDAIDADVNSIENARSGDETIRSFKRIGYKRDLGPGVYDIHSPVVPPKEQIVEKLQSFLKVLRPNQIVVNPDCGLKTRKWPETIAALKNMVEATRQVRAELQG